MFFVRNQKGDVIAVTSRKEDAFAFLKSDNSLLVEDTNTQNGSLVKVSVDSIGK
jgi:hypothetical protein